MSVSDADENVRLLLFIVRLFVCLNRNCRLNQSLVVISDNKRIQFIKKKSSFKFRLFIMSGRCDRNVDDPFVQVRPFLPTML